MALIMRGICCYIVGRGVQSSVTVHYMGVECQISEKTVLRNYLMAP